MQKPIDHEVLLTAINAVENKYMATDHRGTVLEATDDEMAAIWAITQPYDSNTIHTVEVTSVQFEAISKFSLQQITLHETEQIVGHSATWIFRRSKAYLKGQLVIGEMNWEESN